MMPTEAYTHRCCIHSRGGRGTARGQGPAIPSKWTKSGRKVVEDDVRKENEREEAQKLRNKRKQFVDTGATKIADIRGTGAEEQKERMYHHLFVHDKMVTPVPVIDGASTSNWPKNISVHFNVDHFKDSNKNGGRRPKGLVNNLREKPLVTIAVRDQTSFDDFRVVLQSLLGSSWMSNDDFDIVIANDKESAMLGNGASRRREIAAHAPTRHVSAMDTPGIERPVQHAHQSPRSRQASQMREDSGTPAKSTARIPFYAKTPGPGRKTHADTRPNMKPAALPNTPGRLRVPTSRHSISAALGQGQSQGSSPTIRRNHLVKKTPARARPSSRFVSTANTPA